MDPSSFFKLKIGGSDAFRMPRMSFTKDTALFLALGIIFLIVCGLLAWDAYLFFFFTPSATEKNFMTIPRAPRITQGDIDQAISVLDEREARIEEILKTVPR